MAPFFSFGTNDLTQTALGVSRDDAGRFLASYVEKGIFARDPFVSLDIEGVGELITIAVERGGGRPSSSSAFAASMAAIRLRSTSARPPASIMSAPRPTASRCAAGGGAGGATQEGLSGRAGGGGGSAGAPARDGAGLHACARRLERLALAASLGAGHSSR